MKATKGLRAGLVRSLVLCCSIGSTAFAGEFNVVTNQLYVGKTDIIYTSGGTYQLKGRDIVVSLTGSVSKQSVGGRLSSLLLALHWDGPSVFQNTAVFTIPVRSTAEGEKTTYAKVYNENIGIEISVEYGEENKVAKIDYKETILFGSGSAPQEFSINLSQ